MRANLGSRVLQFAGARGPGAVGRLRRASGTARPTAASPPRIAPHAPYTVSDDDLRGAADAAAPAGCEGAHARRGRHRADQQEHRRRAASRPSRCSTDTGVLDAGCIIAHGNGIVAERHPAARQAARPGRRHPRPEGLPEVRARPADAHPATCMAAGVPVGYCTDGVASNNTHGHPGEHAHHGHLAEADRRRRHLVHERRWRCRWPARVGRRAGHAGARSASCASARCADVILVDCQRLPLPADARPGRRAGVLGAAHRRAHHHRRRPGADARPRSCSPSIARRCSPSSASARAEITDRSHGRTIQDYNAH